MIRLCYPFSRRLCVGFALCATLVWMGSCSRAATNLPPALARLNQSIYFRAWAGDGGRLAAFVMLDFVTPTNAVPDLSVNPYIFWHRGPGANERFSVIFIAQSSRQRSLPDWKSDVSLGDRTWSSRLQFLDVSRSTFSSRITVTGIIARDELERAAKSTELRALLFTYTGSDSLLFAPSTPARISALLDATR